MVLVYGAEHQLDLIRAEAANRDVTVHIVIDIIHVLELHLESGVVPASCRRSLYIVVEDADQAHAERHWRISAGVHDPV